MKKAIIILICIMMVAVACKSKISENDAIKITQEFVNDQVKFYVNEEDTSTVVSRAKIIIQNTELIEDIWIVSLQVESNREGEIKKSDLIIHINALTSEVIKMDKPVK